MNYTRTLLKNGLRLLTIPMSSLESVTVLVLVGSGSRYETKRNSGISHFLEHMAFKGTEKRPSAMDISSIIDGMGGDFNAFTSKEYTGYFIKSAKGKIEISMDVLSDMLMHSKLDEVEINKEKGVIIEEINLYEDMPARKIHDVYEYLLYGDTPMGWDISGDKEIIKAIERQDFVDYMGKFYSADNITVVVAGGVEESEVVTLAEKYFAPMKQFGTEKHIPVVEKQVEPQVLIKHKETEQMHIALGVRTISVHSEKRYPLSVLAAILGGGMSSRLFDEIREKRGLAYYVRSSSEEYDDVGTLVSTAGVDPKRMEEALEVMVAEYAKVAGGKMNLTKDELQKAKEFMKGHLVLELEDSRSVAVYYGIQELLEDSVENPNDVIEKIDKVTIEDVESVGREFFKSASLNLALIGNFEDRQKLLSLLKL